jgi:Mitochondrial small ribosomal subunit Rsm22
MNRRGLVRPLEDDWRDALDAVARARGWPTSRDVAKLAAKVDALSAAYNDPARARAAMRDAGAARLGFSFPRDVPKGAAAVRELVGTGALRLDRPLRVLDLGAGLGATTWGLVRALDAMAEQRAARSGGPPEGGVVEATWMDADAEALQLAEAIVRARQGRAGALELQVRTVARSLGAAPAGAFDVVLLGQVLSELDVASPDELRRDRHVELLRGLLRDRVAPGGALVVVEPALRDRTRHLHRVRDALVELGASVFAPCLHAAPCPALARETDWCHEDLAVDLPPWLVPVARAAGLRHEGLTFSYLVLRAPGPEGAREPRLVDLLPAQGVPRVAHLRVVSEAIRTKGKHEAFVCGELAGQDGPVVARAKLMRLDRDANPGNELWEHLDRGDVVVVAPAPDAERPRVGPTTTLERATFDGTESDRGESR